jgi:crossover junction endodeoxyribonuclease RuvC
MRILGIDPGSRFTGWGVLLREGNRTTYLASGTLRLDAARPLPERLLRLSEGIEALLGEQRPEACALERIFTARNAHSALVLGHARGVIVAAVARHGLPLHEYSASQVKQAVVGTGRATKHQMQQMVAMLLGLPGRNGQGRPAAGNGHSASGGGRAQPGVAPRAPLQEDEADALAVALTHAAASRRGPLP